MSDFNHIFRSSSFKELESKIEHLFDKIQKSNSNFIEFLQEAHRLEFVPTDSIFNKIQISINELEDRKRKIIGILNNFKEIYKKNNFYNECFVNNNKTFNLNVDCPCISDKWRSYYFKENYKELNKPDYGGCLICENSRKLNLIYKFELTKLDPSKVVVNIKPFENIDKNKNSNVINHLFKSYDIIIGFYFKLYSLNGNNFDRKKLFIHKKYGYYNNFDSEIYKSFKLKDYYYDKNSFGDKYPFDIWRSGRITDINRLIVFTQK